MYSKKLTFHGTFKGFYRLYLVKMLITIVTLGLYYPWARVAILKYKYSNTDLLGTRFSFEGKPEEIFKGYRILWFLGICYLGGKYIIPDPIIGIAVTGIAGFVLMCLYPWMMVSSYRYRLSRTIWRGISFAYVGTVKNMYKIVFKWIGVLVGIVLLIGLSSMVPFLLGALFVVLGIGIPILYAAFQVNIYKELVHNIKYGNLSFEFWGDPVELFKYRFLGLLLAIPTIGLSVFWMFKKENEFKLANTLVFQEGECVGGLRLHYNFWHFVGFNILNFLIIVFSLGLAMPWIVIRSTNFYFQYLEINTELSLEQIEQLEVDKESAFGDTFADSLSFDFGVY